MKVKVNGREVACDHNVTYAQAVLLAFPMAVDTRGFDVTYRGPGGEGPAGTLRPGDTIRVADAMEFKVVDTPRPQVKPP